LELTLHNQASEVPLVHQALDRFAVDHKLDVRRLARLHVALEEHLTNIISYGYNDQRVGVIRVRFALGSSELRVEIEDDGRPFNPVEAPEADTSLPLEQKPVGGLGIHLIRKSVDEVSYTRYCERNLLVLVTRLGNANEAGSERNKR